MTGVEALVGWHDEPGKSDEVSKIMGPALKRHSVGGERNLEAGEGKHWVEREGKASWGTMQSPEEAGAYLAKLRDGALLGTKYGSRYVGSFIADFHRTLLKGGVFLYPGTAKAPKGKLRLLYEANPLALLAEQAGGRATTAGGADAKGGSEARRILELVPAEPHERTTLVIGSAAEVAAFGDVVAANADSLPRER